MDQTESPEIPDRGGERGLKNPGLPAGDEGGKEERNEGRSIGGMILTFNAQSTTEVISG